MNASELFMAKYGHSCADHTSRMAHEIAVMKRDRERRESESIRPGGLDPKGMIYPTGQRVGKDYQHLRTRLAS